jgi:hypothetical protein
MMEKACREPCCTLASALCIPTCGWFKKSGWKYAEIIILQNSQLLSGPTVNEGLWIMHSFSRAGEGGTEHIRTLQSSNILKRNSFKSFSVMIVVFTKEFGTSCYKLLGLTLFKVVGLQELQKHGNATQPYVRTHTLWGQVLFVRFYFKSFQEVIHLATTEHSVLYLLT